MAVRDSEFRAYAYIRQSLGDVGWDTRNPRRGGAVYTQGEFRQHDPLLTAALGNLTPENIVLIPTTAGHTYWIIEAKANIADLQLALAEARDYAALVNAHSANKSRFITGLAGTPDQSIYIETHYWNGSQWRSVSINNYDTTGFLTVDQCRSIVDSNNPAADNFDDDPERFLRKAQAINDTLHANEVPIGERARVLAALLLALAYDPNLPVHSTASRMVRDINGCIVDFLRNHGKAQFAPAVKLVEPIAESNHTKYRQAIIDTLQILREMNIRSAINSSDDALGKFYETFLKYANGAKEMGIVLTPRHITKFAVEILSITPYDKVFDPACGTGGFLVSSMDAMRKTCNTEHYTSFKNDGLFGVEQRDDVYGLALVNMIFRGDGKSNIENGNCFDFEFWQRDGAIFHTGKQTQSLDGATKPFTHSLLNPPFKLKETAEVEFVDYALSQTKHGGILLAILPHVVIEGRKYLHWRTELLKRHTVRSVVKLDKNVFYPITESTYALIVQAHVPHNICDGVAMGVLFDDNHRARRSKQLSAYEARDNVETLTGILRHFLLGRSLVETDKPRELTVTVLRKETFAPEAYLDNGPPTHAVDFSARYASLDAAKRQVAAKTTNVRNQDTRTTACMKRFKVLELVENVIRPPLQTLKGLPPGNVPIVSATANNNGIAAWRRVSAAVCFERCVTVSCIHNTKPCEAFWHPYQFSALAGKCLVLELKQEWLDNETAILYLCEVITACNSWRYDYARQVRLDELEVYLPACLDGQPDFVAMSV